MSKLFASAAVALAVALSFSAAAFADKGSGGGGGQTELRVEGVVTAVGANSVTISTQGGAAVTVTVTGRTKIERNGRETTLASLKVGDRGQARYAVGGVANKVETTSP